VILPEHLIAGRHRHEHHGRRGGPAKGRHEADGNEEPPEAHAAGLHRHELTVAREASERDQQSEQQRHRNAERERLRDERREHRGEHAQRHALRDERLDVAPERFDDEDEGEDDQPDAKRHQDLADDVPVDDSHSTQGLGRSAAAS
jgi:hypothetical protein